VRSIICQLGSCGLRRYAYTNRNARAYEHTFADEYTTANYNSNADEHACADLNANTDLYFDTFCHTFTEADSDSSRICRFSSQGYIGFT